MGYTFEKYPSVKENGNEKIKIGDEIDICRYIMFGFDIQKVIDTADIIEGVRFVNLETTIEWKGKCGREKDFKDIELIKKYLNK